MWRDIPGRVDVQQPGEYGLISLLVPPRRRAHAVRALFLMRRLAALIVTALAIAAAFVVMWQRSGPPPPRLVLLYAPCTVNKNFLSPYNPAVHYTPSLQEFSRDAVVFTRAQTEEAQS